MRSANSIQCYQLRADCKHYRILLPVDDADWEIFHLFDGRSLRSKWTPVRVEVFRDKGLNRNLPPSDLPSLTARVPVFGTRALEVLEDLLQDHGEVLPLDCVEEPYYAYNITRLVDALDVEHSRIKLFDHGGVMDIPEPAFYGRMIQDLTIFKIDQKPKGRPFVTQAFVDRVEETGLKGFLFKPVSVT